MMTTAIGDGQNWSFGSYVFDGDRIQQRATQGNKIIVGRSTTKYKSGFEYDEKGLRRINSKELATKDFDFYQDSNEETLFETVSWNGDQKGQFALLESLVNLHSYQLVEAADYKFSLARQFLVRTSDLRSKSADLNGLFEKVRNLGNPEAAPTDGKGCVSCHRVNSHVLNRAAYLKGFPQCLSASMASKRGDCDEIKETPALDAKEIEEFFKNTPELRSPALRFETPIVVDFNLRHLGYYLSFPSVSLVKQMRASHSAEILNTPLSQQDAPVP
jgi:hypothetical protein